MSIARLLNEMVSVLAALEIPCMLTGSFAAAVHGAGRATMDVDFVIEPTPVALAQFVDRMLSSGRYVSMDAAHEALAARSMFNVVDVETGWKVDLIIRKDRPFSVAEFARRTPLSFGSIVLPVATVEDLVLAKLEWAHLGGSARQIEDVRALLRLAANTFDVAYVGPWIHALGIHAEWSACRGALSEGR